MTEFMRVEQPDSVLGTKAASFSALSPFPELLVQHVSHLQILGIILGDVHAD